MKFYKKIIASRKSTNTPSLIELVPAKPSIHSPLRGWAGPNNFLTSLSPSRKRVIDNTQPASLLETPLKNSPPKRKLHDLSSCSTSLLSTANDSDEDQSNFATLKSPSHTPYSKERQLQIPSLFTASDDSGDDLPGLPTLPTSPPLKHYHNTPASLLASSGGLGFNNAEFSITPFKRLTGQRRTPEKTITKDMLTHDVTLEETRALQPLLRHDGGLAILARRRDQLDEKETIKVNEAKAMLEELGINPNTIHHHPEWKGSYHEIYLASEKKERKKESEEERKEESKKKNKEYVIKILKAKHVGRNQAIINRAYEEYDCLRQHGFPVIPLMLTKEQTLSHTAWVMQKVEPLPEQRSQEVGQVLWDRLAALWEKEVQVYPDLRKSNIGVIPLPDHNEGHKKDHDKGRDSGQAVLFDFREELDDFEITCQMEDSLKTWSFDATFNTLMMEKLNALLSKK